MMLVNGDRADIVVTDQVSAVNPAVRLYGLARKKLVFYCHYPDVLLCSDRGSWLRRTYRWPFDALERYTTPICDVLIVNSEYTAETLRATFQNVLERVDVLYPPIDTGVKRDSKKDLPKGLNNFFLSLNRYERKKDLKLVIEAFAEFVKSQSDAKDIKLVMAGGYDPRLAENVEYFEELESVITDFGLTDRVVMIKNVSDSVRGALLAAATAVVYSPQFEHFGIVPCEAMAAGTPVIAWNNGGPKESIAHYKTGWLCNRKSEFAEAMRMSLDKKSSMSSACKARVEKLFSLTAFTNKLVSLLQ
jgi:alpha-1,3/alpha-1,6-mannosyltransferase